MFCSLIKTCVYIIFDLGNVLKIPVITGRVPARIVRGTYILSADIFYYLRVLFLHFCPRWVDFNTEGSSNNDILC